MKRVEISEGSIYQTKDGRWRGALLLGYNGRGQRVRKYFSGNSRADVVRKRNEFIATYDGGLQGNSITLETWINDWNKQRARVAAPSTMANSLRAGRRVVEGIGKYRIEQIGIAEARELEAHLRATGVPTCEVGATMRFFMAAMRAATRDGILKENMASAYKPPAFEYKHRRALTAEEARRVIRTAYDEGDSLASLWHVAVATGARIGELLGLRWEYVDGRQIHLEWQVQTIRWSHGERCGCGEDVLAFECPRRRVGAPDGYEYELVGGSRYLVRPKSKSSRRVAVIPDGVEWPKPNGRFVWSSRKGMPLLHEVASKRWRAAQERAGVDDPVTFHALRHTAATLLLEGGLPVGVIAQVLGHSNVSTTQAVYLHTTDVMRFRAADALGAALNG